MEKSNNTCTVKTAPAEGGARPGSEDSKSSAAPAGFQTVERANRGDSEAEDKHGKGQRASRLQASLYNPKRMEQLSLPAPEEQGDEETRTSVAEVKDVPEVL